MPKFSSTYQPKRKRPSIKNVDFSKTSAAKITRFTEEQYNVLNQKEILGLTKRAYELAEKRVKAINKKGYESIALQRYFGGSLPSVPTSDTSIQQLRRKFASMQRFLKAKTSTAQGIKQYYESQAKRIFGPDSTETLDPETAKRFWNAFNEFMHQNPIYIEESDRVRQTIARMSFWYKSDFTAEDLSDILKEMEGKVRDPAATKTYLRTKKTFYTGESEYDLDDYDW